MLPLTDWVLPVRKVGDVAQAIWCDIKLLDSRTFCNLFLKLMTMLSKILRRAAMAAKIPELLESGFNLPNSPSNRKM